MRYLLIALLCFIASPAFAIKLGVPADCEVGKTCFIQNYVDVQKGPEYRDYRCNHMAYDEHKGVDFRLPDLATMEKGIDVLAASDGTVRAIRNDMPDEKITPETKDKVANRECGNGLAIVHEDGWETQYCHMKQGSVIVKPQQKVKRGEVLGKIGLSGMTEFPHVHLSVRHHGKAIDPFTGKEMGQSACDAQDADLSDSLWLADVLKQVAYAPTAMLNAGLTIEKPNYEDMQKGKFRETEAVLVEKEGEQLPFIIAWIDIMGVFAGDDLEVTIESPDGLLKFTHTQIFDKAKAQQFYFSGKRLGPVEYNKPYRATFSLTRIKNNVREEVFRVDRELTLRKQ